MSGGELIPEDATPVSSLAVIQMVIRNRNPIPAGSRLKIVFPAEVMLEGSEGSNYE